MSRHRPAAAGIRALPDRPTTVAHRRRLPWRSVAPARAEAAPAAPAPAEEYVELCDRVRVLLGSGHSREAVDAAQRALRVLPRGLEAQKLLGLALLERGEARAALGVFQAALACDPIDLVALTGAAEAQERLASPAEAAPLWLRAYEAEPGLPEVEQRLQAAQFAASPPLPGNAASGPRQVAITRPALSRIYLRGGLYEHAAAEARAVLSREPERPDAQLTLAEAFWRSGDPESAAAVAAATLEKLPDCTAANLLLAAHLQAIGTDPAAPLARVRAVDPAGTIASRLFDDREPPPLFGEQLAGPQWSVTRAAAPSVLRAAEEAATAPAPPEAEPVPSQPAVTEPAEQVTKEPELVAAEESVPQPSEALEAAPFPEALEPEAKEPEIAEPTITPEELAALWRMPAAEAEPAEREGAAATGETWAAGQDAEADVKDREAAAQPAEPPAAFEAAAVATAVQSEPATAASGQASLSSASAATVLAAADEAMAGGRYLEAARAYGEALRALRAARDGESDR